MTLIKPHSWASNSVFIYYPYPPFILCNHKIRLQVEVHHIDAFNTPTLLKDLVEITI